MTDRKDRENERRGWLSKSYLVSPCSSAPFRWGRRSCLGLRTGVSPHFSMNSVREILALRGGYERGRIPLPSPMPPESGAPPHNTHPTMLPLHSSPLRSPTLLRSPPSPSPSPLAPASPPPLRSPSPHTTTTPTLSKTQPRSIRRWVEPRQILAPLEFSPLPFPPYFSPFLPLFATPTNPLVPRTPCSLYFSLSLARFFLRFALSLALSRSLAVVLSRLCLLSFAPIRTDTDTRPRPPRGTSTSTTKNDHCGRVHRWSATLRGSTSSAVSSGSSAQHTATYQNGCSLSLSFLFFSSSSFLPPSISSYSQPLCEICVFRFSSPSALLPSTRS